MTTIVLTAKIEGLQVTPVSITARTVKCTKRNAQLSVTGDPSYNATEWCTAALTAVEQTFPTHFKAQHHIQLDVEGGDGRLAEEMGLAIGVAVACEMKLIPAKVIGRALDKKMYIGGLLRDGSIRMADGTLAYAKTAENLAVDLVVAMGYALAASQYADVEVYALRKLEEIRRFENQAWDVTETQPPTSGAPEEKLDFTDPPANAKAMTMLRQAMEIAAVGRHNILVVAHDPGPVTFMARRLHALLGPLADLEEQRDVGMAYSLGGKLQRDLGIPTKRPFRTPHHTASSFALVGSDRPASMHTIGELGLANHGVLYPDRLQEFSKASLDALANAWRANSKSPDRGTYLAPTPLIFACVTPCPCNRIPRSNCTCRVEDMVRFYSRLAHVLDLFDIVVQLSSDNWTPCDYAVDSLADVAARVAVARRRYLDALKMSNGKLFAGSTDSPTTRVANTLAIMHDKPSPMFGVAALYARLDR